MSLKSFMKNIIILAQVQNTYSIIQKELTSLLLQFMIHLHILHLNITSWYYSSMISNSYYKSS